MEISGLVVLGIAVLLLHAILERRSTGRSGGKPADDAADAGGDIASSANAPYHALVAQRKDTP
jgi:hypothetical protein